VLYGTQRISSAAVAIPVADEKCSPYHTALQASEESYNCLFVGTKPAYCNFTSFGADVTNGTCIVPSEPQFMSSVFGKPCSTNNDCLAFRVPTNFRGEGCVRAQSCESRGGSTHFLPKPPTPAQPLPPAAARPLQCVQDGVMTGTCAFASPSVSDPCVSDVDCFSGDPDLLRCDLTTHACARPPDSPPFCSSPDECGPGFFCNTTSLPYVCNATLPIGSPCSNAGSDPCTRGAECSDALSPSSSVCVATNSLATGASFFAPAYAFYSAATVAAEVCASGLGVPDVNITTGYAADTGRCVDALDYALVGKACDACEWSDGPTGPFSNLPVAAGGSLVCAPVNNTGVPRCLLLPSTLYRASYASTYARIVAPCLLNAKGPGGVPCTLDSSSPAACWKLRCFGALAELTLSIGGLGASYFEPSWLTYWPALQVGSIGGCEGGERGACCTTPPLTPPAGSDGRGDRLRCSEPPGADILPRRKSGGRVRGATDHGRSGA
jgi:hypothetical protein